MNGERETIDDLMWGLIEDPELKNEWKIQRAANDPIVKGVIGLFTTYGYHDPAVEDTIRDVLEQRIVGVYDVPSERSEETLELAELLVRAGRGYCGEA